jgi:benzylsuccinate CoA-transferase BbsF subunit
MLEAQGAMMGPAILDYTVNGNEWDAMGYGEILGQVYEPYGVYPCSGEDKWIIIACANDEEWQSMVSVIGKSSWAPTLNSPPKGPRGKLAKSLIKNFLEWTRKCTAKQVFRLSTRSRRRRRHSVVRRGLVSRHSPACSRPHRRDRSSTLGENYPSRCAGIPSLSAANAARVAPWIGVNNDQVFGEILGLSTEAIEELKAREAIK